MFIHEGMFKTFPHPQNVNLKTSTFSNVKKSKNRKCKNTQIKTKYQQQKSNILFNKINIPTF